MSEISFSTATKKQVTSSTI